MRLVPKTRTMSHAEYDPSLVYRFLHLDKIAEAGCHRLFAQDMISLLSKCQDDILVHRVLHSDDDCICQAFSNGLVRLCGCFEEILPGIEDKGIIDSVCLGKEGAGVVTRLRNRYDLALIGLIERIRSVVLWIRSSVRSGIGDGIRITRTVPRCPQPMTARVMGMVGTELMLVSFGSVLEEERGQSALVPIVNPGLM